MSVDKEAVAAAEAYEALFVPAIFHHWTSHVLDAASVQDGDRVLDIACGTGVLAREAVKRVGTSGLVSGVDPAEGMLAVARKTEPTVDWRAGTAEALPFDEAMFDAVVSQFGLMFFTDRVGAFGEMARVLVPGGRIAVAVWDALEQIPAIAREVQILDRLAGADAADALRAPFILGDAGELRRLAEVSDLVSVEVKRHEGLARFPSIRVLVEADLRGWLPLMGVVVDEDVIDQILTAAEGELEEFVAADGAMVFDMPALILTARTPSVD